MLCDFIPSHRIDSFLKLRILLGLHQAPQRKTSLQELGDRLYVGDVSLLNQAVTDLSLHGLVCANNDSLALADCPEITYCLECLTDTFNDPMARQGLLKQIAALQTRCSCSYDAHGSD